MPVAEPDASFFRKLDRVVDEVRDDLCQSVLVRHDDAIRHFSTKEICTPSGAFRRDDCSISDNRALMSISESVNSNVPASILATSRISLISCRSNSLLLLMILIYSFRSSSSSAMVSRLEKPTIAFSGVRISWLILARKADFKRSDSSALSLAFLSSISSSFCLSIRISNLFSACWCAGKSKAP